MKAWQSHWSPYAYILMLLVYV